MLIIFGLALAAFARPALADSELTLEENSDLTKLALEDLANVRVSTVYGASRYEQEASKAPSTVTIIDSDEIKKYGWRTLAEILNSVNGLYINSDRNYSYLGLRGFSPPGDYNSRALLMVDGHRINEPVFESAFIGTEFPLDIDLIDRVEIVRGPSFSAFGDNAVFAVINIVTRRGRDINGAEASVTTGSFDSYEGRFTLGKKFRNGIELSLSGSVYDSAGQPNLYYPAFNQPTNNNGIAHHADYDSFQKYFGTLSYRDWTLRGMFGTRTKGIPTGSFGTTFNDSRAKTTDDEGYLEASYHHKFADEYDVTAKSSFDYYRYRGIYPYGATLNHDSADGRSVAAEFQVAKKLFDLHTVLAGAEVRDNFRQDQGNFNDAPYASLLDSRASSWSASLFAQGDFVLLTNLVLSTGGRYDHYSTFGDTLNPRAGLIFNPWPKTTLKLLYGMAFRAPNSYELYYNGPGSEANTRLKPESVTTYQIVLEQAFQKNNHFTATLYLHDIDQLITQVTDPANGNLVYRNIGGARSKGLELGLDGSPFRNVRGRIGYALQQTTDKMTGAEVSNSPRHLLKFNLIVPLYEDKVFSGIEVQYASSIKTLDGDRAGGHLLVNWTLFSQRLAKGLELSASLYNVFDETYASPGAGEHTQDEIPQDGRTFRVKLTYHY